MENYTYNGILIVIGLIIIYQSYRLIADQQKLKRDLNKMKDDYNLEFKGPGGSVSKQRKNYDTQLYTDDWRHEVGPIEPTTSELRDNIDRKERHSVSGSLNRPTEEQIHEVEKARKMHNV